MGQPNDAGSQMLQTEKIAMKCIQEHLLSGYEARINGNALSAARQGEEVLLSVAARFSAHFETLNAECASRLWPKKERRKRKTQTIAWGDPIQELKDAFLKVETQYLLHSRSHEECSRLFRQLLSLIETASSSPNPEEFCILGRLNWKYIEKMLPVQEPAVCALLPYLLTAYAYHFRKNRLMSRGSTSVEGAFSQDEVEIVKKSQIRNQLKTLSTLFGFCDYGIKFQECKRGSIDRASLKNELVLDYVFYTWCVIFCSYERDHPKSGLSAINYSLSYALYLYYKGDEQYKDYLENPRMYERKILSHAYDVYYSGTYWFF